MKKIYDIMPPGNDEKEESQWLKEKKKPVVKKEKVKNKKKPRKTKGTKKIFLIIPAGVLIVLFFVCLILSSRARLDLEIRIKTRQISLSENVKVKEGDVASLENKIITGVIQEQEEKGSQTFTASGRQAVGEKAKGKITIYNKQQPAAPLTLRATTRFLSADASKIFRVEKGVVVPKATLVGGKVQPGAIEVEVVAEEPGEDYNIGASQFSLPGLSGTVLFYNVWAESKSPMAGGSKTEKIIVSKADLETAQSALENQLREKALNNLKQKLSAGLILNENAFLDDDFTISCSAKEGDFADSFQCAASLKIKGLVFQEQDIKDLGLWLFSFETTGNEELKEEMFSFTANPKAVVLKDKQMDMDVSFIGQAVISFDETSLINDILGRNQNEIIEVLANNYSQVEVLSMKFWPFWVKEAPKSKNKINLSLTF